MDIDNSVGRVWGGIGKMSKRVRGEGGQGRGMKWRDIYNSVNSKKFKLIKKEHWQMRSQ